ncbi:hypothetical protein D3C81_2006010 [compost metagenome]
MPMVCTMMPLAAAIWAACSGVMALAVSLPSVSRINTLSGSSALANSFRARPMASPMAVLGPAMPMPVSSSSSVTLAWSRVSGACG